ncbi:hypothetical protein [Paenibacillus alba]|uniref:Uncharacterized protein n=1 Tax=Paenibacillus alba TaxID=1197127 RepID=A0ABU6GD00_9BACL|nr:hypothetical protein [Paenibacillus alba]MEC0232086.1 hypothetical protein [Paenibacillus alba]NQX68889.1 hypothetical protein [Paenibacillus alba]
MIPFANTWPYDIVMKDIYVAECPFCHSPNVLLPLKIHELTSIREGKKKLLVFPCCHNKLTLVDTDRDYLLADTAIRNH